MGGDFSPAVAVIGAALVAAIGLIATCGERWNRRKVQPAAEPERTWIDERIANERDPGRRTAWRMIRDLNKEDL